MSSIPINPETLERAILALAQSRYPGRAVRVYWDESEGDATAAPISDAAAESARIRRGNGLPSQAVSNRSEQT